MVPFKPRSLIVVCLTCWGLNQLQRVCFKHGYARIVFFKNHFYSCRKFDLLIIFFLIQNFLDNSINISSLIVKFPNYWAKTKLNMLPEYSTFCLEFFSNRNHKALFIWRKVILYRRLTLVPELPWARQLFLRFLTKLGEPFTWQTKIFLSRRGDAPRRATRFSWYTHTISPYKHFGSPIWVNSVKARQSEHTRALLTQVKGSIFVSCKHSLKLTRLGGWPPDLGQFFSIWTAKAQLILKVSHHLRLKPDLMSIILGTMSPKLFTELISLLLTN